MVITYHIKVNGKTRRFTEATALDNYIKKNKPSKKSVIILKNENKIEIGQLTVENYLRYEKAHTN